MTDAAVASTNIERVRGGYAAFDSGDLDAIRDLFDPNIVWHVAGRSHLAKDYRGIDEVLGFFAELVKETDGTLKNEVHDIVGSDEHVVALVTQRGERNGKKLEVRCAQVLHMKDGKTTESWFLTDDAYELDAFYG
jgi:ketosteroid isomerase-like protein